MTLNLYLADGVTIASEVRWYMTIVSKYANTNILYIQFLYLKIALESPN